MRSFFSLMSAAVVAGSLLFSMFLMLADRTPENLLLAICFQQLAIINIMTGTLLGNKVS